MSRRTGKPSYLLPTRDSRRSRIVRLAAVVTGVGLAAALLGGAVGYTAGRPDPVDSSIADMREAEAQRDTQQIAELTGTARRLSGQISPVLTALQADTSTSGQAGPEQARQWQQTVRQAAQPLADPPSGTTATNVARGGLRVALDQAALAVDTYLVAVTGPAAQRAALTQLAARQAAQAVGTWSVAATQLDQINIDAGHGHQHVHLDTGTGGGAFAPDHAEEGTGG
ncbi:hypothetical protein DKT68_11600 [Micromonospora acroterricola]|uniref:Uncharacterized protein n=1 Tax=Micromonospora acroterricola TaxID=2202421 RepID=A0A317D4D5_9ACTN|nr:hypothetical protein [Micromonospora acroterricola]PWR09579.1 hypothetical protein DKT68_11600 [Micromonospora acroterricola]